MLVNFFLFFKGDVSQNRAEKMQGVALQQGEQEVQKIRPVEINGECRRSADTLRSSILSMEDNDPY